MRIRFPVLVFLFAVVAGASAFDLDKIDQRNALWKEVWENEADVFVELKTKAAGLFDRTERFSLKYMGPKIVVHPDGSQESRVWSRQPARWPFEVEGGKAWIYVRDVTEEGPVIRLVAREEPEDGKILYNREIVVPWKTKVFSLHSNKEIIDAKIVVAEREKD